MREHRLPATRTARYAALGPPDAPDVWFVLHGYGQLAHRFLRAFVPLDDGTRLIVAPEALNRFYVDEAHKKVGATWMTREDRLTDIADYVRYLDAVAAAVLEGRTAPRRVTVLGFSQGASTACRWLALGQARAHRLVLWAGELPPDLDLAAAAERLRALEIVFVTGREERFITAKVQDAMTRRLAEHGIGHRVVAFDGGHELEEGTLRQLA
jgi:predicted esterase